MITFPDADRECELAATLPSEQVERFGASDCDCLGHLLQPSSTDRLVDAALEVGGVRNDSS